MKEKLVSLLITGIFFSAIMTPAMAQNIQDFQGSAQITIYIGLVISEELATNGVQMAKL